MDLRKYFYPIIKWWWLLALAAVLAGGVSFIAVLQEPDIYQARTTLMIGRAINDPNPTTGEFVLGTQMAGAYADIAKRQIVRDATRKALGLQRLPEYNAQALLNTQIIEIVVNDPDPALAQRVANELANQLILLSPAAVEPEEMERQEFVNTQLDNLKTQIEETETTIEQLKVNLGNLISAKDIADTKAQISGLENKLNTLQNTFSDLLTNSSQGVSNTITVIEPAALPARPIGSKKLITVLLAMAVGLGLAGSAAYLLEYLDGTPKSQEELASLFQTPVVGSIFEVVEKNRGKIFTQGKDQRRPWKSVSINLKKDVEHQEKQFSIADNPRHPITEAFRNLRTNIGYMNPSGQSASILVTSPGGNDGKTWVSANLAISMVQEGKRVIVIDADLRNPSLHKFFQVEREKGLADLLQGHAVAEVLKYNNGNKVGIITAGELPNNPTEVININKVEHILKDLKEYVDVVIIDSPPFFISDAAVLSTKVDSVLAVVCPGRTLKDSIRAMTEQIRLVGGNLSGVVINRIPFKQLKYYYGYPYTSLEKYSLSADRLQKEPH